MNETLEFFTPLLIILFATIIAFTDITNVWPRRYRTLYAFIGGNITGVALLVLLVVYHLRLPLYFHKENEPHTQLVCATILQPGYIPRLN
eukprot:1753798-Rhodomonas_salina.1